MKLIFCPHCYDVVTLTLQTRYCACKKSSGEYLDELNAVYSGDAVPLGIANLSFTKAVLEQPDLGDGKEFKAFVIPKQCDTFKFTKNE